MAQAMTWRGVLQLVIWFLGILMLAVMATAAKYCLPETSFYAETVLYFHGALTVLWTFIVIVLASMPPSDK